MEVLPRDGDVKSAQAWLNTTPPNKGMKLTKRVAAPVKAS
jgi:hypothetical protein